MKDNSRQLTEAPGSGPRRDASVRRRLVAGLAVLSLAGAALVVSAAPAAATYATGGSGLYTGSIDWFEWGEDAQEIPSEGTTRTNTRVVAGQTIATTCSLSNITGNTSLQTYRSGNWRGDALDDLYNIGGPDSANQMVYGLGNTDVDTADGPHTVNFDFACSATFNGQPISLQGLVLADAEASGGFEYVEAQPNGNATWRVIDRFRSDNCDAFFTSAILDANNRLRFQNNDECAATSPTGEGPIAVGFMDGATSANVQINGGGRSAVALGVVLDIDFGDAPESYGEAGSLFEPSWSGGTVPVGSTNVTTPDFTLGTPTAPNLRLGALVDGDAAQLFSADATGDDNTALADEDAVGPMGTISVSPGSAYSLDVACNGVGVVAGWIDWNGNGQFDDGERSATAACTAGTAALAWVVPQDAVSQLGTDLSFLRLRIAPTAAGVASPVGVTTSGEVEDHALNIQLPTLSIAKSSDAGADSAVGDTVTYEVTVSNTSDAPFTAEFPASMVDDLSAVLDDASYNGDAAVAFSGSSTSAPPTVSGTDLSWSGPLAVGESATITYSVTLINTGDGTVTNNACVPAELVAAGDEPCATTTTELPKLTIAKSASTSELPANGGTVTYTVTVTNQGPGDTTVDNPALFDDDLSAVLDDGTLDEESITASTGAATFGGTTLSWEGVLAAGESATVTYTVTYDATSGDQQLLNVACLPAALAQNPADLCRQVQIPGSGLTQWKDVNPATGSAVVPGQVVTYTLSFSNTGAVAATVDTFDDLSNVLDDATVVSAPAAGTGNLVVGAVDGEGHVAITGSVPVGATYTVTYSVQVLGWADQGNHVLGNVLADPTGSCLPDRCTTENPVPHLAIEKTSSATTATAGDTVTFTITLTNDSAVDYTTANPASFTDDLSDVLDDATYDGDASADRGTVEVADSTLTWTGALEAGQSAVVTYSVTVTAAGDNVLTNTACTPPNGSDPPECDTTVTNLPNVIASKSSDPASGAAVEAGQVVTYTLSWTNNGTAAGVVDSVDDLSRVIDDADVTEEPAASSTAVTVAFDGTLIDTTGPILAGETITVTYQVTVRADGDRGDNNLVNQLVPDNPDVTPPPPVEHPVGELEDSKGVNPASGTTVRPGQVLTYTLTFTNVGRADVSVARDDVLTGVLDDADVTTVPTASDPALAVSGIVDGRFSISGVLTPDQTVEVTYQVTVRADGQRGDDQLGNFLVDAGEIPPTECVPVEGEAPDCTVNPVSNVTIVKASDPASGTAVQVGQKITYTLALTNVSGNASAAPAAVDFTDHMSNVLDDATLTTAPTSSSASVQAAFSEATIRIRGSIPSGGVVTVTYAVTVKPFAQQGDHSIGNVVAVTGTSPICVEGSQLCTQHSVPPPVPGLPNTGGEVPWWAIVIALLATIMGAAMVTRSRRQRDLKIGA